MSRSRLHSAKRTATYKKAKTRGESGRESNGEPESSESFTAALVTTLPMYEFRPVEQTPYLSLAFSQQDKIFSLQ